MKYVSIPVFVCVLLLAVSLTVSAGSGGEVAFSLADGDFPPIRGYYYSEGDELRYDFAVSPGETVEAVPEFVKLEYDWVNLRGLNAPNLHIAIKITIPDDASVKTKKEFRADEKSYTCRVVRTDKLEYQYVLTDRELSIMPFSGSGSLFDGAIELGEPRALTSEDGFEVMYFVRREPFSEIMYSDTDIPCAIMENGKAITADSYEAWYSDGVLHYYDIVSGELRAARFSEDGRSCESDTLVAKLGLSGSIQWLSESGGIYLIATLDDDIISLYKYDGELSKPHTVKLSLGDYYRPRVAAVVSNGAACFRVQTSYHIYAGGKTHYCALSLDSWEVLASGSCEIPSNERMLAIYYDEWRDFDAYFDGKVMYALDNCSYSIYLNTDSETDIYAVNALKLIALQGGGLIPELVTLSEVGADGLIYSKQPFSGLFPIGSNTSYIVRLGFDTTDGEG